MLPGSDSEKNIHDPPLSHSRYISVISAADFVFVVRRLLAEDYLMILALSIIVSITSVLHTYLADIYLMSLPPESTGLSPEDYLSRLTVVWRTDGVAIILSVFGIWTIKMNFMLFFRRLGHQIRAYTTFWWVAVVIIVACGAVLFGILPYDCILNDSAWINTHCATTSKMGYISSVYKANVAVDVLSDFISKPISLSKQFFEGLLGRHQRGINHY